jgi:hypothetical protein
MLRLGIVVITTRTVALVIHFYVALMKDFKVYVKYTNLKCYRQLRQFWGRICRHCEVL